MSKRQNYFSGCLLVVAVCLLAGGQATPASPQAATLPPLSAAVLDALTARSNDAEGRRLQIGVARRFDSPAIINHDTLAPDSWTILPNGWRSSTVAVSSKGALGLRVHLQALSLPQGALLRVYDPANPASAPAEITPLTLGGRSDAWSEMIFSDQAIVECLVPSAVDPGTVAFSVTEVSHVYALPTIQGSLKEGTCNNDVTCYPAWSNEASGVARLSFVDGGNTYLCTGCLLAPRVTTVAGDYFLTANHCITDQTIASTMELFWFYQTSTCNGPVPNISTVPHTSGGATVLAASTASDFTFMRLRQSAPSGAAHLAWSTNLPGTTETLTGIHHPTGAYKRISFGHRAGLDADFIAARWFSGVTEPGSSGSPLFNASHQVIGQLNGGFAGPGSSCSNPSAPDQYGRFDITYQSIKSWLEGSGGSSTPSVFQKGSYNGLFQSADGISPQTSGFVSVATTTKGKFSGRLQFAAARYSFSGQFDQNGTAQVKVPRRNLNSLTVSLQLNADDPDKLTGAITDGTWSADLSADRSVFDGRTSISPQLGQYTMTIPGDPTSATEPGGDSFATVTVDKTGRVRLNGFLADGTHISQYTTVSKEGRWPFWSPLYAGQGLLFSWATFSGADSLSGDVTWIKPPLARSKLYPGGFQVTRAILGSRYTRPLAGKSALNLTQGTLILEGGDLPQTISEAVMVILNRLTAINGDKVSLSFSPSTGTFTGHAAAPGISKSISFRGVVLQNQDIASGYFLGIDRSGRVVLEP